MITPFTPPTDNLFKFISIAGLIAMITGFVLIIGFRDIPKELALKHSGKEKMLKKEIEILSEEIKHRLKDDSKMNDSIKLAIEKMNFSDSISADILFVLPPDEQKAFKMLLFKKERLSQQGELTEFYQSKTEKNSDDYVLLMIFGELAAMLGFLGWWKYAQKPSDKMEELKFKLEKNKTLAEDLWKENCQSCLKSLLIMKQRGSEKDGSISKHYCSNCYSNGEFTEPELTYKEAYDRLEQECKKRNYSRRKKNNTVILLCDTIRWREKFEW